MVNAVTNSNRTSIFSRKIRKSFWRCQILLKYDLIESFRLGSSMTDEDVTWIRHDYLRKIWKWTNQPKETAIRLDLEYFSTSFAMYNGCVTYHFPQYPMVAGSLDIQRNSAFHLRLLGFVFILRNSFVYVSSIKLTDAPESCRLSRPRWDCFSKSTPFTFETISRCFISRSPLLVIVYQRRFVWCRMVLAKGNFFSFWAIAMAHGDNFAFAQVIVTYPRHIFSLSGGWSFFKCQARTR